MQKLNTTMIGALKKVIFYIILIMIWELVYKIFVDWLNIWKAYSFSSPAEVLNTFSVLIGDNTLLIAIITSLKRLIIAYFISVIVGTLVGFALVKYKYIDENLSPMILGFQTIPSVCWIPFAILWYGINENTILFITVIGSIFSIIISTETGIKNVNPIYIKAAKTMGVSEKKMYLNVIIPAALPQMVAGMKQGWSFAWRALMAGEMLAGTKGLGQVLMEGRELGDISQVMAIMIVIVVFGLIFDKFLFGKFEKNIRYKCGLEKKN